MLRVCDSSGQCGRLRFMVAAVEYATGECPDSSVLTDGHVGHFPLSLTVSLPLRVSLTGHIPCEFLGSLVPNRL